MRPSLQDLPVEIIEVICSFLMDHMTVLCSWRLFDLRLTPRTLHEKTVDTFATAAFKHLAVHPNSADLYRLLGVSKSPHSARKVESLAILNYDRVVSLDEFDDARKARDSINASRRERREATTVIRRAYQEQDDSDYVERYARHASALRHSVYICL